MTFLRADRLEPQRSVLLVIDVQEKLLPAIDGADRVAASSGRLVAGAALFKVPILTTEQYPQGIGPTDARLRAQLVAAGSAFHVKEAFSACCDEPTRAALGRLDREQVVICGIETHVCVQQTALDLRAMDYDVFVCVDAVGSRSPLDHQVALDRLRQAGAQVTTVESVLFEWCHQCGTADFKAMLPIIKAGQPRT